MRPTGRLLTSVALVLASGMTSAQAETNGHMPSVNGAFMGQSVEDESLLIDALQNIQQRHVDKALESLEPLISKHPNFKLAQLIYGDLLLAKTQPIDTFGSFPGAPSEKIEAFRDEARARLRHHLSHRGPDRVPASLVQLSNTQKRAVVVDVSESRLYLFENYEGEPYLVGDYYVSTGLNGAKKSIEGDQKTPLGVYFITENISAKTLPDFYGAGAFPVNYPNEWDRRLGRTGYGIWIHGVPSDTYSRPPRASDGCVALANPDLQAIADALQPPHTPVILANSVDWVERPDLMARRGEFLQQFETWRRDWESRDHEAYARHYSRNFKNGVKTYRGWLRHKRRVNANKDYIKIRVSDLSIFDYPAEQNMVVATFQQDYHSSNYRRRLWKRQYWRKDADAVWRIYYEGVF